MPFPLLTRQRLTLLSSPPPPFTLSVLKLAVSSKGGGGFLLNCENMRMPAGRIPTKGSFGSPFVRALIITYPMMTSGWFSCHWPSLGHQMKKCRQRSCSKSSTSCAHEINQPTFKPISIYGAVIICCRTGKGKTQRNTYACLLEVTSIIQLVERWIHLKGIDISFYGSRLALWLFAPADIASVKIFYSPPSKMRA